MLDFIRVAACVPQVTVGNTVRNTEAILAMAREAAEKKPQLTVFPELSLTGYTCADLFFQSALLTGAREGLYEIVRSSAARRRSMIVQSLTSSGQTESPTARRLYRSSSSTVLPQAVQRMVLPRQDI